MHIHINELNNEHGVNPTNSGQMGKTLYPWLRQAEDTIEI